MSLIVDDSIELLGGNAKQVTYLIRQGTEVPDVSHRNNQLNVSGTLTTHLLLCHLNTTTVADDTLIANALVFAAGTLIVLRRTEDALTEQTVTLGLVGTIVDGFRLGNLAKGILKYFLWRSKTNGNLGEITLYFVNLS